jgi:hypothetical protein
LRSSRAKSADWGLIRSGARNIDQCLAAAKRGGRKLDTAGSVETAARAWAAESEQATKANATTRAVIVENQRTGHTTLAAIAQELEARGVRTPAGRDRWAPAQVSRLPAACAD